MDKSATLLGQKGKNNSRYQRDIERSFAVIYHNLKRIQDEKPSQDRLSRRRHSEPQTHAPNPALLRRCEDTVSRERAHSASAITPDPRQNKRRVSFSDIQTSIPETLGSRVASKVCNFTERDKDQETTRHLPF